MDMTKDTQICIFWKNHEPVFKSWLRDSVTFGFMLLCIYVSQGSTWWTFFTGTLFIFFLGSKVAKRLKEDRKDFHSKDEVRRWLDSLD